MKIFCTPIVSDIVRSLNGTKENLQNIRYFSSSCPCELGAATFACEVRTAGPCVVILSSLVHTLLANPEDVYLCTYFILKLLHEFLHLCHRSNSNQQGTPENFKRARSPPSTVVAPKGVEAGRWL